MFCLYSVCGFDPLLKLAGVSFNYFKAVKYALGRQFMVPSNIEILRRKAEELYEDRTIFYGDHLVFEVPGAKLDCCDKNLRFQLHTLSCIERRYLWPVFFSDDEAWFDRLRLPFLKRNAPLPVQLKTSRSMLRLCLPMEHFYLGVTAYTRFRSP